MILLFVFAGKKYSGYLSNIKITRVTSCSLLLSVNNLARSSCGIDLEGILDSFNQIF